MNAGKNSNKVSSFQVAPTLCLIEFEAAGQFYRRCRSRSLMLRPITMELFTRHLFLALPVLTRVSLAARL